MSSEAWVALAGMLFCALPAVLALYAIGLRLACHLADAPVPPFFKSCFVGASSFALTLVTWWLAGSVLGATPLDDIESPQRLLARWCAVPLTAAVCWIYYMPILGLRAVQSGRVVLVQFIYIGLFGIGFILFNLLQTIAK